MIWSKCEAREAAAALAAGRSGRRRGVSQGRSGGSGGGAAMAPRAAPPEGGTEPTRQRFKASLAVRSLFFFPPSPPLHGNVLCFVRTVCRLFSPEPDPARTEEEEEEGRDTHTQGTMSLSPSRRCEKAAGASFAAAPCSLAGKKTKQNTKKNQNTSEPRHIPQHRFYKPTERLVLSRRNGRAGRTLPGTCRCRGQPLPKQPLTFSLPQGPQDGPALA